jgi:hypothetical protein
MKTNAFKLIQMMMVAFVTATSVSASFAQTSPVGFIKIVNGDVRVIDNAGERTLKSGDPVFENNCFVAAAQGSASLVLRDGTTVVLSESSQLELKEFAFDAKTQKGNILVNLLQGSMRMLTGLIAKASPEAIQVKTKTLSVGIRGTDFIVETQDTP